jgi:hypothetical protein
MGSLRVRNIKRGLYRLSPSIGKAPVKSDMKNIFEAEVERLDEREIAKAIEWLGGGGFSSVEIYYNSIYGSLIKEAARSPDNEV